MVTGQRTWSKRRALSLVEFAVASAIMGLIAVAVGTVAMAVQRLSSASNGVVETVQHARAVQEYFTRAVTRAHASLEFPGVVVWSEPIGGNVFPETLIVWAPETVAVHPEGLPLFSELLVFCAHPNRRNELIVIANRQDTRVVPALEDVAGWQAEIQAFKTDNANQAIVLTSLLRVVQWEGSGGLTSEERRRPAIRFLVEQRPSRFEFSDLEAGTLQWGDLSWPLGIYNSQTGTVRIRCNIEFQLTVPRSETEEVLAFLEGAAMSFLVEAPNTSAGSGSAGSSSTGSGGTGFTSGGSMQGAGMFP